jgi:two-component system cell cycle response regulator
MIEQATEVKLHGRVLIADDDPGFRYMLVRRAERLGLEVVQAEDGQKAMDALDEHEFDVIVADLYMPGCTGIDVIQAARERDSDIQSIILTGSATVETAVEALRAGVYDYLTKPLDAVTAFDISLTRALELRNLIRENKRLFTEVQRLAVTDSLTGLFNRHKLNEALEVEAERARRYERPLSIIMVDLDNMKRYNDAFGHHAGDVILQRVAQAIRSQVRRVDLPTRYGGDEFIVLLPEADIEEAGAVAERIAAQIRTLEHLHQRITASLGVIQWSEGYPSFDAFLRAVDEVLYRAKRAGGNRVELGPADGKKPHV